MGDAEFTPAPAKPTKVMVCRLCGALVPETWTGTHSNAHRLGLIVAVEKMTEGGQ